MGFLSVNPNPLNQRVGDCVVRAISLTTGEPWEQVYWDLAEYGGRMADMPSSNAVWGAYLKDRGFRRRAVDDPVPREVPGYSFESREDPNVLRYEGESNFARMIDGMETEKFCRIMEELVESLQIIEPRLYAAVIRKFRE